MLHRTECVYMVHYNKDMNECGGVGRRVRLALWSLEAQMCERLDRKYRAASLQHQVECLTDNNRLVFCRPSGLLYKRLSSADSLLHKEKICSTMLWIFSPYLREYTQTEWILMLLTVFLFITTWIPPDFLDPKCYLFFYTEYLHLRKYQTFNYFQFFNFLLPVAFLFKNGTIQVLTIMSNGHQALDKNDTYHFLSSSLPLIWSQTETWQNPIL